MRTLHIKFILLTGSFFLLSAFPLIASRVTASSPILKDSTKFYFKNNLLLGVSTSNYSNGIETGYGLAFGYSRFQLGGLVKMKKNFDVTLGEAALLGGVRFMMSRLYATVSAGPAVKTDGYEKIIYYYGYGFPKSLGPQFVGGKWNGVMIHVECLFRLSNRNGLGIYITGFLSDGNQELAAGLNYMFGTRQYAAR